MGQIQNSINQLLFSTQVGSGFIANTPAFSEIKGAKAREDVKIKPAQQTAEEAMAQSLEDLIKEIDASQEYTPTGRVSKTKQALEARYRNVAGAKFQMERGVRDFPSLAEKYNPQIEKYGMELDEIRALQEEKGFRQAQKAVLKKKQDTERAKQARQSLTEGATD